MKSLLCMSSLFTFLTAQAEGFEIFSVNEQHCQSGAGLKTAASGTATRTEYRVEDGFTRMTVKTGEESNTSETSEETFKLVQMAKNAFMAIPEATALAPGKQFFVMVSKTTSDLVVYSADSLGEKCGGEMVFSQLSRKIPGSVSLPASRRDASEIF